MARRNKWFHLLKRLFGSDVDSKYEKKAKRKRWVFAKSKSKCLPALPGLSLQRSRSLGDAEHEQSKRAVAVAAATTSAVEAAVAAAQAAAEVGRLTGSPLSYPRAQKVAAIKIQTAFRGYLAKKALKALKGLVKLQALIRGQIVRQQMENTLKGLQSLMKIQSQTCASRARALVDCQVEDYENITLTKTNNSEVMKIADRRRPATPLSTKSDHPDVVEDRRLSWLDEWVGGQPSDKDIPEIFLTPCRDYNTKGKLEDSKLRSFNQSRRASTEDDDSFTSSPSFPSYMATTASAKAKSRSLSTPRQRLRSTDSCSDYGVPTTNRLLSPLSSVASDTGFTRKVRTWGSPQHKSRSGPLKCRHSSDHLPIDWDRHGAFR